jgi:hypothetical protein
MAMLIERMERGFCAGTLVTSDPFDEEEWKGGVDGHG